MDVEKVRFLKESVKLFKEIIRSQENQKINDDLKTQILNFPLLSQQPQEDFEKKTKKIPKKPKKIIQSLSKPNYFFATFFHFQEYIPLKDLLSLRHTNQKFFELITEFLQRERLVKEEHSLVQGVFSLKNQKFQLSQLKKFCLTQIPNNILPLISLNYEELLYKCQNLLNKNSLKTLMEIKIREKTFDIDKIFKPFCILFVKRPEFTRNLGISEENWYETFRKLLPKLYQKSENRDFFYYYDLIKEEHIKDFVKQIQFFGNNYNDFGFLKENKSLLFLLEIYKMMISLYFCENPFIVRKKTQDEMIEPYVKLIEKELKLMNCVRKILKIEEKMKIILDFSNINIKNTNQKNILSNEIIAGILSFIPNKELISLKVLSKKTKENIENILQNRLGTQMKLLPNDFKNFILILNDPLNLLPKNIKEFNSIKKSQNSYENLLVLFPKAIDYESFYKHYHILKEKNNLFCLSHKTISKILEKSTDNSNLQLLLTALRILYFGFNFLDNKQLYELINMNCSLDFLVKNKYSDYFTRDLIKTLENEFFPFSKNPKKSENLKTKKSNDIKKKFFFKTSQEFLILTTKILPFLNFKDLISWGMCSKLCMMQVVSSLETRKKILQRKLKLNEIDKKSEIKSLNLLRNLRKTEQNSSHDIENIDNLCELDKETIRYLKSLNKCPKKFEIFLKPFSLIFPSKNEKFRSFQTFLKRKDLFTMINNIDIELIPQETMFLVEKFLFEYKDFFRDQKLNADVIYNKLGSWLNSLIGFYCRVRKFHVTYEETVNMRFPERNRNIYQMIDKIYEELFTLLKVQDNFNNILSNFLNYSF